MISEEISRSPLGKNTDYISQYNPSLLCSISRGNTWKDYGHERPPYQGVDIWNAYELSWLNKKGLPQSFIGEIKIPVISRYIIESKSLKLYLNSFNQSPFKDREQVRKILESDLSKCANALVQVNLISFNNNSIILSDFKGSCLDTLDIKIEKYNRDAHLLKSGNIKVNQEKLYSHLLKSNCPITGQPDWGSIFIEYSGTQINHASLLKYIISYRQQGGFHEQCTEIIFMDILQQCKPDELTVYARYLRRGGLDINPYRSTKNDLPQNLRLFRQ